MSHRTREQMMHARREASEDRRSEAQVALDGAVDKVAEAISGPPQDKSVRPPFPGRSAEEHLENLAIFLACLEQPAFVDLIIDFVAREWDLSYAQVHRLRRFACGPAGLPKIQHRGSSELGAPVVLGQGAYRHDGNGRLIDREA